MIVVGLFTLSRHLCYEMDCLPQFVPRQNRLSQVYR